MNFYFNYKQTYEYTTLNTEMFEHARITQQYSINGVTQRRLDSYHVTFSTNEIASFCHWFCEDL